MKTILPILLKLVACIALLCCAVDAQAQNCDQQYRQAVDLYEQGNIDSALAVIKGCINIKKQFQNTEKATRAEMYWIAMQSSLLLKENEQAEKYLMEMLALRPRYQSSDRDLQDVATMQKKLMVLPRLSIAIEVGLSRSWARVIRPYYSFIGQNQQPLYKHYRPSIIAPTISAQFRWAWSKQLSLSVGISQLTKRFSYDYALTQTSTNTIAATTEDQLRIETYTLEHQYVHEQKMLFLDLPLSLRYQINTQSHWAPYIEAGLYVSLLLNATKIVKYQQKDEFYSENEDGTLLYSTEEVSKDIFTTDIGSFFLKGSYGALVGAGTSFQVKRNLRFNAGVRLRYGLNNLLHQADRYTYEDLTYSFYDVSDDFALNTLTLYASWEIPTGYRAFRRKEK